MTQQQCETINLILLTPTLSFSSHVLQVLKIVRAKVEICNNKGILKLHNTHSRNSRILYLYDLNLQC